MKESSKQYDMTSELVAFAGVRASTYNLEDAYAFEASAFRQRLADASKIFTRDFQSRGTRSEAELADDFERMQGARQFIMSEHADLIKSMKTLGVPQNKVVSIQKGAGVTDDIRMQMLTGKYKPWKPSDDTIKRASEADPTRVEAVKRWINLQPKEQPL